MRHGFVAFIDESGQEGGQKEGGASEFFVMSAVVCRRDGGHTLSKAFRDAVRELGKGPGYHPPKFTKLSSNVNNRHVVFKHLGLAPIRHVSVICHKEQFENDRMLKRHGKLYFFAAQLILERISWACRDSHRERPCHDGRCFIVFSERESLKYERFQEYAKDIKAGRSLYASNAEWAHLDIDSMYSLPFSANCDGLLAVDYVASAIGKAIELNCVGLSDDRPIRQLCRNVYRPKGKCFSNGIKLFPKSAESLRENDVRFWWINRLFEGART